MSVAACVFPVEYDLPPNERWSHEGLTREHMSQVRQIEGYLEATILCWPYRMSVYDGKAADHRQGSIPGSLTDPRRNGRGLAALALVQCGWGLPRCGRESGGAATATRHRCKFTYVPKTVGLLLRLIGTSRYTCLGYVSKR